MRAEKEDLEVLKGLVLTHIDISGDEMLLTTKDNRKFKFYHEQDCCESVYIKDVEGDITKLLNGTIEEIDIVESDPLADKDERFYDSATETTIKFTVDNETVIVRWIGESNGYYSESVDFKEI